MKNKVLQKAKKLYQLSERGIGGEKDNALRMLKQHLKRYNISLKEFMDEMKVASIKISQLHTLMTEKKFVKSIEK